MTASEINAVRSALLLCCSLVVVLAEGPASTGSAQGISATRPPVATALRNPPHQIERNPYRRRKFFLDQRIFPFDRVQTGALKAAREYYDRTWGSESRVPQVNVTTWTSIGPDRIGNVSAVSGRLNSIAVHPTTPTTI